MLALLAMTSAPDITILSNSKETVLVVLALILDVGMVLSEWKRASMQSACYGFWTSCCDNMEGQEVSIDSKLGVSIPGLAVKSNPNTRNF